jgi:hypothetical protein
VRQVASAARSAAGDQAKAPAAANQARSPHRLGADHIGLGSCGGWRFGRHSLNKKDAGRGRGSHLSAEGVALARMVGEGLGPFALVVTSHRMHHPIHFRGAGRFLVLARDGVTEPNLVWKDTVLVRTGQTVDILFDVTNPGVWMAHCHISEHLQSGMMLDFHVASTGEG